MSKTTRLALLALTLLLVTIPLTFGRPGLPSGLKADEPAYFLMALSLARDRDLRCDIPDLHRLVDAFPFSPTNNLILMSDDGWRTVYFGKPFAYSLFAAPAAALFGPGGMIAFNMALALGMIWLGAFYLAQYNRPGIAALFSTGFFVASAGFAYVFWLHPETFNMAAVTLSLFLLFYRFAPGRPGRGRRGARWAAWRDRLWNDATRPVIGGAALGLAVYNKPMLLALGLPAFYLYVVRRRRLRDALAWGAGLVLSVGLLAGLAYGLTGHTTAYVGAARGSFEVCDPDVMPVAPAPAPASASAAAPAAAPTAVHAGGPAGGAEAAKAPATRAASWSWIFGLPDFHPHELLENLTYFFVGRHTGLALYFPFSILATLLFLGFERRSGARWAVALSLAVVALFFLLWIPFNWHGGGGFIGNRYFVNAYPAFLFLVTRIAPAWTPVAGYLAGGVFLGSILLTPLGRAVPNPTLQFHVRNFPFRHFPLELTLRQVPGYQTINFGSVQIRGRDDEVMPRGESVWLLGAHDSELWLVSVEPLDQLLFWVASPATRNSIDLELGDAHAHLDFGPGVAGGPVRLVELEPGGPSRIHWSQGVPLYVYRLGASVATGAVEKYTFFAPPKRCDYFPYTPSWEASFYAGAEVTYLGDRERLDRDVFSLAWRGARIPARVEAGSEFTVVDRLTNTSRATWPASGPVRVNLAYHWLGPGGRTVIEEGMRSHLAADVPPGGKAVVRQQIEAPPRPGTYTLVLEPLYEYVGWFGARQGPSATWRHEVQVVPAGGGSAAAPTARSPAP